MKIDYTWDIVKVNYVLKEGNLYYVIKNIEYKYTGIDSETGNSFVVPGNVDLKKPNPENFIDRENITKENYIQWLLNCGLSEHYLQQIIFFEIMQKNKI